VFTLIAAPSVLAAGYVCAMVETLVSPANGPVCCGTPADLGLAYEDVAFTGARGATLSGWLIPPRNGAVVILLHGYGSTRGEMLPHAAMLARHGYGLLLYDMRGHGQSQRTTRSLGWLDVEDVRAAVGWLQVLGAAPAGVGILGFSVGGEVAIRAAAQDTRIAAVVADGPSAAVMQDFAPARSFSDYLAAAMRWLGDRYLGLRSSVDPPPGVAAVIRRISPRPLLLISSGAAYEPEVVRHYYDHAAAPKDLLEIPEAWHGGGLTVRPEEYEARVVALFDQALH
jgi:pimeloyl-ACP methyl ester carboxylesterase